MTDNSLSLTGRLDILQEVYRGQFGQDFDPAMFRADQFYAAQVLERSLRDGSADLQDLARPMEQQLLSNLDVETIEIDGLGRHEREGDDATVTIRLGEAGFASAFAGEAEQAAFEAEQAAIEAEQAAIGEERRAASAGHVQLTPKEVHILAQLRIQYRKTFGMFFDIFEFTGNDLYARTLLKLSVASGSAPLAALAREFMTEHDTPRLHRRKGAADLEISLH